jgi:hypothetical protein
VVSCEHGDEPSGSIKGEKIFIWLSDYYLLKMTATWSELVVA